MCSSRKYPYPPLPPTEGNGNSEGRGGGSKKEVISEGGGGVTSRGLFPGAPSKADELSKTNNRSGEQTLSYFTVDDLLKQEL